MNLEISLAVHEDVQSNSRKEGVAVYAMGNKIKLIARFVNSGDASVTFDDPASSQSTLLLFTNTEDEELIEVEINPGSVDVTGEMTAPESADIVFEPGDSKTLVIDVHQYVVDFSLQPGHYLTQVEYDGIKSSEVNYIIEYVAESKNLLLELAMNEDEVYWIRRQAVDYLKEHHQGPNILLPPDIESPENKSARVKINQTNVAKYKG